MMDTIGQLSFSDRLLILRRKKNLSQREIAKRLGISPTNIMNYEKSVYFPSAEVLVNLAPILDTSIDFLLTGKNPVAIRDKDLLSLTEKTDRLPESERDYVKGLVSNFLNKYSLEDKRKVA